MSAGLVANGQAESDRPNVLFLIWDDLNCDLGTYGHPLVKSPNIDRLAERGLRFNNAFCQFPLCGPSRASFMTGLYPDQTLVRRNTIYIREHLPDVQSMSQLFRRAGYFATRIGKIYHYNVPKHIGTSGHDDPYSWDYTINPRGRDANEEDRIFSLVPGQFGGTMSWHAADGSDEEQTDGIAAREAVGLLEQYAKDGRPFFLAVGLFRPHTPYVAPKKYFDWYPRDSIQVPTVPEGYDETLPEPALNSIRRKREHVGISEEMARQAIQAYYASISFADAQTGLILDALDRTGLSRNTIVVFTSDHGYHMGEHGHYQKTTLFENATRVPLILAGPGIHSKGQTSEALVEMVDFYPTLADLCDLEAPPYLAGHSLVPVIHDPAASVRDEAFSQLNNGYSIRTDRYRYTEWGEEGSRGKELYDRQSDPEEWVNLASSRAHQGIVSQLSNRLHERIDSARKPPVGLKQIRFDNNRRVPVNHAIRVWGREKE